MAENQNPTSTPEQEPVIATTPDSPLTGITEESARKRKSDTVTLKAGDTLGALAAKNKTTVRDIVALNDLGDPRNIAVGQKIRLK